ncbi:hypothetical protein L3X39_07175 [Sabulilitoribacter multivorans]|uniref:Lipocalin-like domain-containing protein n=1 Tax=Flaviramulus multivorans TaxID=1304750 RepID=A0ABS9II73_9FLAO|nr:hypothetical protein [Flaviramulus multivorans]MCF7560414.1 hypothetical protein [Flaviramulus multivorans]
MKKLLVCISILYVSICFSQNLECCKTIQEVEQAITGDWKLKGDTENVIYRFTFGNKNGYVEVLEELNLPPKAENKDVNGLVNDDHTLVKIKYDKGLFYIDLIYLYGDVSEPINVLNKESFIYGIGDSKHIFIRDKN